MLAQLAVLFIGIAGDRGGAVHKQIAPILAHAHVKPTKMSADLARTLSNHGDDSRAIVRGMHADGVLLVEVVPDGKTKLALRVVIYSADGALQLLNETPLGKNLQLSIDDLESLRTNLDNELGAANAKAATPRKAVATAKPAPKAKAAPVVVDDDLGTGAPHDDDDAPPGLNGKPAKPAPAPAKPRAVARVEEAPPDEAAPTSVTTTAPAASRTDRSVLHAGVGFGVFERTFTAPAISDSYTSSPIQTFHVEAGAEPTRRFGFGGSFDRSINMRTVGLADGDGATTVMRWEVGASFAVVNTPRFRIAPALGIGQRSFTIDSTDPKRSPDTSYRYVALAAAASVALGDRIALHGLLAYEPVIGGSDPMGTMAGATRSAFAANASLDWRPIAHVFTRVAFDYQVFRWAWAGSGATSGGTATDAYPTGLFSLGAEY